MLDIEDLYMHHTVGRSANYRAMYSGYNRL